MGRPNQLSQLSRVGLVSRTNRAGQVTRVNWGHELHLFFLIRVNWRMNYIYVFDSGEFDG